MKLIFCKVDKNIRPISVLPTKLAKNIIESTGVENQRFGTCYKIRKNPRQGQMNFQSEVFQVIVALKCAHDVSHTVYPSPATPNIFVLK